MAKTPKNQDGFQTHIAEPRWQQIVSVGGLLIGIILWIIIEILSN